jgi:hypothetical protein
VRKEGEERGRRDVTITPRDRALLAWTTRHGMVTADQVCRGFFSSLKVTWRRLHKLEETGLLRRNHAWWGMPLIIRTTEAGAHLADVDLAAAPLDYRQLEHNLTVVDLSLELLALNMGARWITERELRRDRMRSVRACGAEPERRTPDGMLVLVGGRRIAIELDRTAKRTRRLEQLARAYAGDREVDAVWWFLPSERAAARMQEVIHQCGLDRLIDARALRSKGK